MSEEAPQAFHPPYMSWATFMGIVEQFRTSGLPAQVDRSVLSSRSGGDQAQFLRTAAGFGFIDAEGTPTERFRAYVDDPEQRPAIMRTVLQECYPDVVRLPPDATPGMLIEQMRALGIEGSETVRKAMTFYLNAARFAELELSPHFKATRPGAGGRRSPRRAGRRNGDNGSAEQQVAAPPADPLAGLHPAVVTLVQSLPSVRLGERVEFSSAERRAWFDYARATFNLIYDRPEGDHEQQ